MPLEIVAGWEIYCCHVVFGILPMVNPLSATPTKWSNILKQFDGKLPTNYSSVCDYFGGLALEGLIHFRSIFPSYSTGKNQETNLLTLSGGIEGEH